MSTGPIYSRVMQAGVRRISVPDPRRPPYVRQPARRPGRTPRVAMHILRHGRDSLGWPRTATERCASGSAYRRRWGTRAGADAQVPRAPSDAPLAAWPAASKIGGRGASWRPDRGIMSVISTSGFRQCRKINSARERLRHPVTPPGPGAGARGPPLAEADHHPVPTTRRPRCGSLAARVYPGGDHATRHRVCSDRFTLYAPPGDQLYSPDAGAAAYRSPQLADGTAGQPGYEQDSPQPSLWSARQSPWRHPGKHFHTTYLRVTVRSPVALFESGRRQRAEPRLLIRRSVRR